MYYFFIYKFVLVINFIRKDKVSYQPKFAIKQYSLSPTKTNSSHYKIILKQQQNKQLQIEIMSNFIIIVKVMRFILRYKYGILQTKTERMDMMISQTTTTTQVIENIQKRINQSQNNFIVKYKKGKNYLRIIPGWPLTNYSIKQGSQLYVEQISSNKFEDKNYEYFNNKYLNNVLGFNKYKLQEMDIVKQQQPNKINIDQQQSLKFDVRKYLDKLCEKMLKQIQKKNIDGFKTIFQQQPIDVPQQYIDQIKQKKITLKDQLGQKGWGALHYAIFCNANEILDILLASDVDVNKSTSDGWLPIQLAIDLKSTSIIQKLLNDPNINLNLVTSRGGPIHTASKLGYKQILTTLLDKDIDIYLKDHTGKTAYEVSLNEECKKILKKYEEKKYSYNQYGKGNLPLSLTTIFRGTIFKAKKPFMNLKQRYVLVDPFQGSMIRYENESDYPKKAKQIVPLSKIGAIKLIEREQKAWHMKKQLHYFSIEHPAKQYYACKYRHTAQKWVSNLILAIKFANELEKNPQLITEFKRNQIIIQDIQLDKAIGQQALKKKKSNNLDLSLSQRRTKKGLDSSQNLEKNLKVSAELQYKSQAQQINETQFHKSNNKIQSQKLNTEFNSITTNKVNFSSFNIIKILGSGQFGKVFLAKHINSGKQYALKALKKKNLILQKQIKYAVMEANILKQANNPFIINLHYAFQTLHYLYLALDYCSGRDLSFHLARQVVFPQNQSRFYIAELILAIEYLHQKQIIYRDLKPENILLEESGHIKLADFGLSKQVNNQKIAKSFCGSPAYLSPEMLSKEGVGKQSDLYGIGAVLYQFLMGQPPYFSLDIQILYNNIKQGKLVFPKNVSPSAKDLITKLLERQPKKRLGYQSMDEIKSHEFFSEIDWQKLNKLQIEPPKRPQFEQDQQSDDQLDYIPNKNRTKFTDIDYNEQTKDFNRFFNFSFARNQ